MSMYSKKILLFILLAQGKHCYYKDSASVSSIKDHFCSISISADHFCNKLDKKWMLVLLSVSKG